MFARHVAPVVIILMACTDSSREGSGGRLGGVFGAERPDEPPVMVNKELPFRYPAPLYARRTQANVMLRLFIDRDGRVVPDSTRVEESSGYGSLDSAAVTGSQELYFIPAKLHGEPMAVSVLFPVYFRHPEAAPLPGDTILRLREEAGGGSNPTSSKPPAPSLPPPASKRP